MTWAGWNDENTARAVRLFTGDCLSAAEVARAIGATRNMIIGKMHRLGHRVDETTRRLKIARQRPPPSPRPPRVRAEKPARAPKPTKAPKVITRAGVPEDTSHRVAFLDRPFGRACAALVDDDLRVACGAPLSGRGSYCAHHAALFFRATKVAA